MPQAKQAQVEVIELSNPPASRQPRYCAGRVLLCVAFTMGLPLQLRGEEDFPYTAYVVAKKKADVCSGPGIDYYATDELEQGAEVEVYQHVGKEWAAIRPPAGSFSLVPTSALEVTGANDLGTVRQEVKTIVGSRLSQRRHDVEYLTLQPDDIVQVLGSTEIQLDDGQDLICYEIAPPAGEFRWVRLRDISRQPPTKLKALSERLAEIRRRSMSSKDVRLPPADQGGSLADLVETPAENEIGFEVSSQAEMQLAPIPKDSFVQPAQFLSGPSNGKTDSDTADQGSHEAEPQLLAAPDFPASDSFHKSITSTATELPPLPSAATDRGDPTVAGNRGWRDATESNDALDQVIAPPGESLSLPPPDLYDDQAPSLSENNSPPNDVTLPSLSASSRFNSRVRTPIQLGPIGKLRLGQELIEIELQLTKQVCQPPSTWRLSELHDRAQAVIDTSDDPKQRSTAQNIIAKIAQFEDVRRRQKTIIARNYDANSQTSRVASKDVLGEPAYDGTGFLMPVVTQDATMPKYVLTDKEGNIIQFVSPKPGMNLKRFEQQRVAILGQKGYLPTYNQPHLMAERVITLDKVR